MKGIYKYSIDYVDRRDAVCCGVTLFVVVSFFCFVFVFFVSTTRYYYGIHSSRDPSFNRSSICMRLDSHTQLPNNCLRPFLFCFVFLFFFLRRCRFFRVVLYHYCRFLFMMLYVVWRGRRMFFSLFRMVVFLPCDTGWIFYISLLCENSLNQSISQ